MKIEISVPSKTFLLGEYVALKGGPCLVLTTAPRFTLLISSIDKEAFSFSGMHPQSPAGKFLTYNENLFRGYHFTFVDPHFGAGGFGASSAQFIMLFAFKHWLAAGEESLTVDNFVDVLDEYQKFAWSGLGVSPSGADIIAQIQGGISFFYRNQNQVSTLQWPFTDYSFVLLHTGNKLATHEHLLTLELDFLTSATESYVLTALKALQQKNISSLAQAIKEFSQRLQEQNLVAENTVNFLKVIEQQKGVVAAKGCGSMGADVILVIVANQFLESFSSWIKQSKLQLVLLDHQASVGLCCHSS